MKRLGIIGVGSAGVQALCHFSAWLDNSWQVVSLHDPNIPIVGIGESTNPSFVTALQYGIDFNIYDNLKELDGTLKIGTVYKKWRERDFINPLIHGGLALHFNTFKLKEFAIPKLKKRWGSKFNSIEGNISNIINFDDKAVVVIDNKEEEFEFVIDCRGFPKEYTEYNVFDYMPLNCGLVHNVETPGDWIYTGHKATKDGWMFEIPLTSRQSYGYMFNDRITSIEEAKMNFSKEINVPVDNLDDIKFKFKSYYTNKLLDKRVLKNGNSAVFFEPMFANSLWFYDQINRSFLSYLNSRLSDLEVNEIFENNVLKVRDMICFNYHGGSLYDTPFWKDAVITTSNILNGSPYFKDAKEKLIQNVERNVWIHDTEPAWVFEPYNLTSIDRNFGYNYFSGV